MGIDVWRRCQCSCHFWSVFLNPLTNLQLTDSNNVLTTPQFTDILADIIILILPIPIVLSIKLDMRKKLAVIGIFMLGAA